jgi:group II intron reverse transcriptase/maturase
MKQLTLDQKDTSLFEETISLTQLHTAYAAVRANRGAPGIDGVTIEAFGDNLAEELTTLAQEVREWHYEPSPVRRVRIPKPDGGERLLGIPCIRDRVLQYSLKLTIESRFEKTFSESSYGFRPGRNQQQAIQAAKKFVDDGRNWVVDIDLEQFFDRINHDRLITALQRKINDNRIIRLIGKTLRSGILDGEVFCQSGEGAVQGSPLSPLLSNIVLDELDSELGKRKLAFCRYADDCNIFVGSRKAAERIMASITRFIENRMKLKVNRAKSKVALASEVKFLGFTVIEGMLVIAKKSMMRAMETVDRLTPRRTHKPLEKQIDEINQWFLGWTSYYALGECPSQLQVVEAHIRRRLRAQIIRAQKKPRFLVKKLGQLGVPLKQARYAAYRAGNTWRISITKAAHRAWPNRWFEQRGLRTRSDEKHPHWHPLETTVTFP